MFYGHFKCAFVWVDLYLSQFTIGNKG